MTETSRFIVATRRFAVAILSGTLVIGGSAGAIWLINAHRADAVSHELDAMMQKLSTDDRVRYFGDNIISWVVDSEDQILRVGVANPASITVVAKKWLGPRAVYYRTTIPERFGLDELRTNRLAAEVQLGCTLSAFINTSGYSGDSREAALRAITWSQGNAQEPADYEQWTGGPLLEVYAEPAPMTYLAFTAGDHLGLGVAILSRSGTRYTASTWACASDPRVSVIAGAPSQLPSSVKVYKHYPVYTHCGVRYVRIGTDVYLASPKLDDGSGNPPAGSRNPYQYGRLVISSDDTAEFTSDVLHAHFVLTANAVPELCD